MFTKKTIIIFFSISLVVCRIIGTQLIGIYDDAFITYRYAENFANGQGFVYNPGEWFLGVTTPAFGFICSVFSLMGLPIPTMAILFNILLELLILIITINILFKHESLITGFIFSILYISSPIITRICVGGMEMNLYILLTLLIIILYSTNKKYSAYILAGLSYFVRPEAILLIVVLTVFDLISEKNYKMIKYPIVSAIVIFIPLLITYFYYEQFLPQSVIAKSGLSDRNLYIFFSKLIFNDVFCIVAFPLTIFGYWKIRTKHKIIKLLGFWVLMIILAYFISGKKIWTWYGAPVHYVFFIFASIGTEIIVNKLYKGEFFNRKLVFLSIAVLPVLFWLTIFLYMRENPVEKNIFSPLKEFCSKTGLNNKDSIFANDIGALGYFSKAYIYDSESLISNVFSKYPNAKEFILNKLPEYLFLNLNRYNMLMVNSFELRNRYIAIERFSKAGEKKLNPNPKKLTDTWIQDYILYKRISKH